MSQLTQKYTPKEKVTPKVTPKEPTLVRIPSSNLWVDLRTGVVYLDPAMLSALRQ